MSIIFHIDLNAFFASCEIARNPKLKNKPVVIGGSVKRGVISTASYEARKYGIHSAMPVFQAQQRCKDLIILPGDMRYYQEVSKSFFNIIHKYTSKYEVASIDECYIDVTDIILYYENIIELAKTIQEDVRNQLHIGCSIGIANNRFLAKMGSDLKKPNGITVLTKENIPYFLWPLPVGQMHGIGKKTTKRLNDEGILTIGDFAKKENYTTIKKLLGRNALIYYNRAHGLDVRKVDLAKHSLQSIGKSSTLRENTDNVDEIKESLRRLSEAVALRAQNKGMVSNQISLTIKYDLQSVVNRSRRIEEPTNDFDKIYETILLLFDLNYTGDPLRLVGVTLNNVISLKNYNKQLTLFNYETEEIQEENNLNTTDELLDQLSSLLSDDLALTTAATLLKK